MTTTIELNADELDYRLFRSLKSMFKGRNIRVTVNTEMDETEYLLSNQANRTFLEESIAQARQGELINVSLEDLK
ncbi:MAG: hypothetical protein U0X91_22050 [Spirosomataceae bacterium]